jgi:hypothetical protein
MVQAAMKRHPKTLFMGTGRVYELKEELFLYRDSAPNRYYAERSSASGPRNREEYLSNRAKWPAIVGIVERGTHLRGDHLEWYEARPLSSELGWAGVVYVVVDGEHVGKYLTPTVPLFRDGKPSEEFLLDRTPFNKVSKDSSSPTDATYR